MRGGSKLWALVPWTIGSPHTKSWPPTMPRTLQKVLGRWRVGGCCVVCGGTYTKFSVLLWAKALVLAWAQAEQLKKKLELSCAKLRPTSLSGLVSVYLEQCELY